LNGSLTFLARRFLRLARAWQERNLSSRFVHVHVHAHENDNVDVDVDVYVDFVVAVHIDKAARFSVSPW